MATDSHDPLDDSLKRAMKALDDQVSDRYFDELPNRTMSRLEEMMQSDVDRPATPVAANDGKSTSPPKPARVEDSGLHDIRALASSTKERVSKKRLTVNPPVDDSYIHTSSASLRAVALPEPSRMVQTGEHAVVVGTGTGPASSLLDAPAVGATEAASAAPITPLARKKPSKAPVLIGTLAVAAAAGVAGFVILNQKKDAADTSAAMISADDKETAPAMTPDPARTVAAPAAAPAEASGAAGAAQEQDSAVMKIAADPSGSDGKAEDRADEGGRKRGNGSGKKDSDKGKDKDKPDQKLDDKKDGDQTPAKGTKGGGTPVSDGTEVKKDDKKSGEGQGESLEDLLAQAGGPDPIVKKDDKPKTDKKALDATDIRKAMSALNQKAQACYAKFGVSGSVGVKLTVAPTGEIKKAVVTGAAAGTPTGDCVAEVVGHAKFPIWDGAPQTVTYSYFLSE